MKRQIYNNLTEWKRSPNRKPLIIRGARQVGKTWLMKAFGKNEFRDHIYLNFENSTRLKNLFEDDFEIPRILRAIEIESGQKIDPKDTLLIFDEIQQAPRALTALKYFQEEASQIAILCAGSMLGVAMHPGGSFPVGKVDFMNLLPMSFIEFLEALGQNDLLSLLESKDWPLITNFKSRLIDLLKQYYYVGGMPEVVKRFVDTRDLTAVRVLQQQLLLAYEQDFSKHAPPELVPRLRLVWNSIPGQLAKENRKFLYGVLRTGARAREFELAIQWLIDCGLVYKVSRVQKAGIPLPAYEASNAFKLFLMDVGLLSAMSQMDPKTLLEGNKAFEEFKGALTEQYVHQQFLTMDGISIYYWAPEVGSAEVDFLLQYDDKLVPVEVKAAENLQAKSLKVYTQKYKPELALRISLSDYREGEELVNLPLYALCPFKK